MIFSLFVRERSLWAKNIQADSSYYKFQIFILAYFAKRTLRKQSYQSKWLVSSHSKTIFLNIRGCNQNNFTDRWTKIVTWINNDHKCAVSWRILRMNLQIETLYISIMIIFLLVAACVLFHKLTITEGRLLSRLSCQIYGLEIIIASRYKEYLKNIIRPALWCSATMPSVFM